MARFKDLTGQRFERLTATERAKDDNWGRAQWLCACDCGAQLIVTSNHLRTGHTRSCGCLKRERSSANMKIVQLARWKHGHTAHGKTHSLYRTWSAMHQRCQNPKCPAYADYGGRGIQVCERWNDFANFLADMGEKPDPRLTLDRIDNDGNYEPSNCRWATRSQQMLNTRHRRWTTCRHGHPVTPDNIFEYGKKEKRRRCLICYRANMKLGTAKRRGAA